jgi:hypothetical protein
VRIELTIEDYNTELIQKGRSSIRDHARRRRIPYKTLRDRISAGAKSKKNWAEARQRLTVVEEEVLKEYCLQLKK